MKKKELLAGKYYVYAVFDKISKHYTQITHCVNDETFIRTFLPQIILSIALRDLQIFKIGIFDDITGDIKPILKKRVNVDCYEFPHSRLSPIGENLSKEDIEKTLQETKNKIIAESSSNENEDKE